MSPGDGRVPAPATCLHARELLQLLEDGLGVPDQDGGHAQLPGRLQILPDVIQEDHLQQKQGEKLLLGAPLGAPSLPNVFGLGELSKELSKEHGSGTQGSDRGLWVPGVPLGVLGCPWVPLGVPGCP